MSRHRYHGQEDSIFCGLYSGSAFEWESVLMLVYLGRKRFLLVADGLSYFLLALFDVLAHNLSFFTSPSNFNSFRAFDLAIGAFLLLCRCS